MKACVLFIGLALLTACATPTGEPTAREGEPTAPIYLVSHGWHTGLVMRRADIPVGLWPEAGDFPQAEYLEVGWGDRDYYQARAPGLWTTLKAALAPTPSVLHVVGFRDPPAVYFPASEVVELRLPRAGVERLVRYIHDAHAREGRPPVAPLGPGLYGDSRFYPARETFHLFNTCNVWTARALRAAGLPVRDAITTEGLMAQVRRLGRVVQAAPGG
ncbi:MAG: hypothetical protein A3E57_02415 [Candidatus Muproteobacteria bacterium RIFCSPHIGHO2_12_FULL_60_33]|nr:MAG: hypothetical protein A2W42_07020 [Candidatus Muproteobacteria bacterium RIFCSPHIGHO2_01_60_12]OGI54536.1 MAG: hypothetical protein A3E57_02415 [Candidatus Muproteobacteria bacterium RIFCSPHIGHO2_12_FULL_60_33]